MSINPTSQADPDAEAAAPRLRTLGDADAAVCTDGVCAVPAAAPAAPEPTATTGAGQ